MSSGAKKQTMNPKPSTVVPPFDLATYNNPLKDVCRILPETIALWRRNQDDWERPLEEEFNRMVADIQGAAVPSPRMLDLIRKMHQMESDPPMKSIELPLSLLNNIRGLLGLPRWDRVRYEIWLDQKERPTATVV